MDYTMEDNDIDMPYAPPLPPQATISRCPYPQAGRSSMQTPNTRYPPMMNPWAAQQGGYNLPTSSIYGTPNVPPSSYGGLPLGYSATPGYYAQWSQAAQSQSVAHPSQQELQPPGSRPFLPPPHPNPRYDNHPFAGTSSPHPFGAWPGGAWPDNFRPMSSYLEEIHAADNNTQYQGMDLMDNGGPPGLSREQAQQRRREREGRERSAEMEAALMRNPLSNVSSHTPNLASSSGWERPSARQGRTLTEAQRRAAVSARAMRDSDTEEEEFGSSEDDTMENLFRSQALLMADDRTLTSVLRGRLGSPVPTKEFLLSLKNLNPDDLAKGERTCMICYNEFGVKNPEGVSEQPVRLPKCKHVFGAICIKKWFKEKDSCPYCRDKVPSESPRKLLMSQAHQLMRRHYSANRPSDAGDLHPSAGRASQEYHTMSSGDHIPPLWSRPSTAGTTEARRRISRGRTGGQRAAHISTRPNSMSSARPYTTAISQLPDEPNNTSQIHARNSSNSEGASPAIAVGSTTNNGDQQLAPLSINSLRSSANSNSYMSSTDSPPADWSSPSGPSYSQNRPTAFGSMRAFQHDIPGQFYHYQAQPTQEEHSITLQSQRQAMQQEAMQLQQNFPRRERFQQEERMREAEDEADIMNSI